MANKALAPVRLAMPGEQILRRIYLIRGQRVMIDSDLAILYGVTTKVLNQAVKRNLARFPEDFMFQLTAEEADSLRSQSVTSKTLRSQFVTAKDSRGGRRNLPYAFTEHGVAMLSSVLKSDRAIQMNILIVRAFLQLREVLATNQALAQRVSQLTTTVKDHAALFDILIQDVAKMDRKLTASLRLLRAPKSKKPRIGFVR